MKFNCNQKELCNSINLILKAIPKKTTMPILKNIMINATDNDVELTANDLNFAIQIKLETATVEECGSVCIDSKLISDITKKLINDLVVLEFDEYSETVNIKCGRTKFKIKGLSTDEYPNIPLVMQKNKIEIQEFNLKSLIDYTNFASSLDKSNAIMNSQLIEINGDRIRMVALDGHRISCAKEYLSDVYDNFEIIVPTETLNKIGSMLKDTGDDDIYIYFEKNFVLFEIKNIKVLSRLTEGKFYNIDMMFNNKYNYEFTIDRLELLSTCERAELLLSDNNIKPLVFNVCNNELQIKLISQLGKLEETLEVESNCTSNFEIGFNTKYIKDMLRVSNDDSIIFKLIDFKSPCLMLGNGKEDFQYLVLPINIK